MVIYLCRWVYLYLDNSRESIQGLCCINRGDVEIGLIT